MLEVKNLSMSYGKHHVLNNINLKLKPGNLYGLIGTNGCGKTSILNAIARLAHFRGKVMISDICSKQYDRKKLASKLSYMRQDTHINFNYTVEEVVYMSQYTNGFNDENKKYIEGIMDVCELSDIKHKSILNISGGQKQRVFFAKTLAQDSDIILIDEGFSNIDIYYQIKFIKYLQWLALNKNKMIIIVIHDINFAINLIDQVIVFKDGAISHQGQTKEIVTNKMIKEVFNVDLEVSHNGIEYKAN